MMETAIENEEWINKTDAAEILGVSVRQLELKTANGQIRKKTLPKKPSDRAARVVYSREDLDAIRAGKPNYYGEPKPETAALAVAPVAAGDPFAGLAAQLAAIARAFPPPVEKRPWLTLAEAELFSGLTRKWLLEQTELENACILTRDMGKHARGGRWRFNREALAAAR
jgi:hypothetical protein